MRHLLSKMEQIGPDLHGSRQGVSSHSDLMYLPAETRRTIKTISHILLCKRITKEVYDDKCISRNPYAIQMHQNIKLQMHMYYRSIEYQEKK